MVLCAKQIIFDPWGSKVPKILLHFFNKINLVSNIKVLSLYSKPKNKSK